MLLVIAAIKEANEEYSGTDGATGIERLQNYQFILDIHFLRQKNDVRVYGMNAASKNVYQADLTPKLTARAARLKHHTRSNEYYASGPYFEVDSMDVRFPLQGSE